MPKKSGSSSNRPSPKRSSRPSKKRPRSKQSTPREGQRLNKILAGAGLGSRREVEELIVQGRVEVDREIVTDLAFKADPQKHSIKVDGQAIKRFRPVYFMLNKPKGVLSTNKDPSGRARVVDFVPDNERVFSVGRLDKSSEGLMLLTNDGELAQKLAHPRYRISKTYFVVVSGVLTKDELAKLHKGVYLAEGFARIDGAKIRKQKKSSTELEITLSEGKNREIRRILARAGHKVVVLKRLAIGGLRLGQLPVGAARQLTAAEVNSLYALTETRPKKKKAAATKQSGTPESARSRTSTAAETKSRPGVSAGTTSYPEQSADDLDEVPITTPYPASDGGFDEDMDDEFVFSPNAGNDDWSFDEDDYDDDFVGGFTSNPSEGKVLGYEDAEEDASSKRSSDKSRGRSTGRSSAQRTARGSVRSTQSRRGASGRASSSSRSSGTRSSNARSSSTRSTAAKRSPKKKAVSPKGRSGKSAGKKGGGRSAAQGSRRGSATGRGGSPKKSPRKSTRKRR